MTEPVIGVRLLDPGIPVPAFAHADDAGADLVCREDVHLEPGERRLVPTGIAVEIPTGWAGFIHPRSGLAARHGLGMVNAPGTIDAGYRGEIMVNLVNHDPHDPIDLQRGDRIAQLVIQAVAHPRFEVRQRLGDSARGEGGHGSTGGIARW
ncbi:dUTP diphosphatase [Aestuariimicrobium sp. p3-SID1156]|uniref:dUTP diphosphatase n=1 Tax=Aestuariimicrobium sp. p3-SID1156 TaxID=2916038 RepID=UPI00223B018B|nr:dUTP diphosphatase [Aestuariimicrobium sp. p3-SID1156]MCT1459037.1 dUTP diphosphatase [Aestuariimicrobium sp. p3-SID1156]